MKIANEQLRYFCRSKVKAIHRTITVHLRTVSHSWSTSRDSRSRTDALSRQRRTRCFTKPFYFNCNKKGNNNNVDVIVFLYSCIFYFFIHFPLGLAYCLGKMFILLDAKKKKSLRRLEVLRNTTQTGDKNLL